ncbi:membrane fusion protein [Pseudoduganella namucuonensis]|uniref:Membrane fusion protein n=1 Tax=Pseudoduganella namucuonensis TaxID=1035707 RepID=A0A1I7HRC2_9BURK|nr:membrane fusion protein [Pseudoduganella namucuonensis]
MTGLVIPNRGVIQLAAPQQGIITQIRASEGQAINVGDPLFVLSSERTSAKGETQASVNDALASRITHLRKELDQQGLQSANKHQEISARLENLHASMRQLESELVLQRQKTKIVRDLSSSLNELAAEGGVSQNAARQKAADLIEQETKISALEGQRLAVQRDIAALNALLSDLPLQGGREASQIKRGIEELKQQASESEAKRQLIVRAEQAGKLAGIVVDVGQAVTAEQRLANLLPKDSLLEAELYVPTKAAGFVRPGTEVLLRYDAYPYQKFGQFHGRVREISLTTIPLGELQRGRGLSSGSNSSPIDASEPVYRVRVSLDAQDVVAAGRAYSLKPGMQLSATLVLEHRTLLEWVLEPLLSISGRL